MAYAFLGHRKPRPRCWVLALLVPVCAPPRAWCSPLVPQLREGLDPGGVGVPESAVKPQTHAGLGGAQVLAGGGCTDPFIDGPRRSRESHRGHKGQCLPWERAPEHRGPRHTVPGAQSCHSRLGTRQYGTEGGTGLSQKGDSGPPGHLIPSMSSEPGPPWRGFCRGFSQASSVPRLGGLLEWRPGVMGLACGGGRLQAVV